MSQWTRQRFATPRCSLIEEKSSPSASTFEFGVGAFAVAVLPRRSGFDVQCLCAGIGEPFAQIFGDELGTVLSDRRCSGTPFHTMTSASAPITLALDAHRPARISRHSRVDSSIRLRRRTLRFYPPPLSPKLVAPYGGPHASARP